MKSRVSVTGKPIVIALGHLALLLFVLMAKPANVWADYAIPEQMEQQVRTALTPPNSWQSQHGRLTSLKINANSILLTFKTNQESSPTKTGFVLRRIDSGTKHEGCLPADDGQLELCSFNKSVEQADVRVAWIEWVQQRDRWSEIEALWVKVEKPAKAWSVTGGSISRSGRLASEPIQLGKDEQPLSWFHKGIVFLALSIFLFALYLPNRSVPALGYSLLVVSIASGVLRLFLPDVLLHMQNDDLLMLAVARGIDDWILSGSISANGTVLTMLRAPIRLLADNPDAIFLSMRFWGILLPSLTLLVGWEYFRNLPTAILAALLVLINPAVLGYSTTVSTYLPAATAFALAWYLAMLAIRQHGLMKLLLMLCSSFALFFASALKQEFLLLLPSLALILFCYIRQSSKYRSWRKDLVWAFVPSLLALVMIGLWFAPFFTDFSDTSGRRLLKLSAGFGHDTLQYFLNPPNILMKLVFLFSLIGIGIKRVRALQIVILGFMAVFIFANSMHGFNQWRYSLIYIVPFMLVLSATLNYLAKRKAVLVSLVILLACVLADVSDGYLVLADTYKAKRIQCFSMIRSLSKDSKRLVLYMPHGQDQNAGLYLASDARHDRMSMTALFPASCAIGADLLLNRLRLEGVEWTRKLFRVSEREKHYSKLFTSNDTLRNDLQVLLDKSPSDRHRIEMEKLLSRCREISNLIDEQKCKSYSQKLKRDLKKYERIEMFIDPQFLISNQEFQPAKSYLPIIQKSIDFAFPASLEKSELIPVRVLWSPANSEAVNPSDREAIWTAP